MMSWITEIPLIPLLVIASFFTYFWLLKFKESLKIGKVKSLGLSLAHVAIGLCAVSLFAFLEDPAGYTLGTQSLFGAVFFMPIAYWLWARLTKRDYKTVFDIFTVCLVFTLLCARINCMLSGCCMGDLIPGLDGLRWPTRELELLYYIVLLIVIIPRVLGDRNRGEMYPLYMMSYGAFRFVDELFRVGNGILHISHLWAALSLIIGAGIWLEMRSNEKRGEKR